MIGVQASGLEEIRADLEALHADLNRDSLLVRSGLKEASASAEVLAAHPLAASRQTVERLRGLLRATPKGPRREELRRLFFAAVDAHLQATLAPLDDAVGFVLAASNVEVNGERVHYFEVVPWLQRQDSLELRARLGEGLGRVYQATNPLLERLLRDQDRLLQSLGFQGFLDFCQAGKGLDYAAALPGLEGSLARTRETYLARMEEWVGADYGRSLAGLTRLDCIHLLRLGRLDHLFPPEAIERLPALLARMGLDVHHPHVRLDLSRRRGKNPQAVCLGVRIPQEVHLLLKPQGGLLDAESLLHELGHALHLAHFDPGLPFEHRYLPRSRALSECFAFLLQGLVANPVFLAALGVSAAEAKGIRRARRLKDLALWRRFGAKQLAEVRMWQQGGPDGGRLYAESLSRHTGFRYEAAGYLADMETEFYAADYLRAWMAEAQLAARLEREFGAGWPLDRRTGELLVSLWREGERWSLEQVLERLGETPSDAGPLEARFAEPA